MKKSLVFSVLMATVAGVFAMEEMKCPVTGDCEAQKAQMVESRVAEMKKSLGWSADQEAKVKAALDASMEKKCAVMKEAKGKVGAIQESTSAELKGILTPKQKKKWEAMDSKTAPCCAMAGDKGHQCPMNEKTATCPLTGKKVK